MLILSHVIIALTSVLFSTYLFFRPSQRKLQASYGLTALTVSSGTYLVVSTHAKILEACLTGLMYLGAVGIATIAAHRKLALQTVKHR
ncbi:MAG: hypothetical protein WC498_02010 [Candidatus Saccharimonadales bacterium]